RARRERLSGRRRERTARRRRPRGRVRRTSQRRSRPDRHNGRVTTPPDDAPASHIDQTLAGCVVLVTADRRRNELEAALTRRGASVRHAAALGMVPHVDDAALLAMTRDLVADPPDTV